MTEQKTSNHFEQSMMTTYLDSGNYWKKLSYSKIQSTEFEVKL